MVGGVQQGVVGGVQQGGVGGGQQVEVGDAQDMVGTNIMDVRELEKEMNRTNSISQQNQPLQQQPLSLLSIFFPDPVCSMT